MSDDLEQKLGGGDGKRCHMPRCTKRRVTLTLCASHASRLLQRFPDEDEPVEDVERQEAA